MTPRREPLHRNRLALPFREETPGEILARARGPASIGKIILTLFQA